MKINNKPKKCDRCDKLCKPTEMWCSWGYWLCRSCYLASKGAV